MLVIRRGAGVAMPGYWAPLSGRLEPGEREDEAVVRETMEEVGISVTPVAKVWECDTHDGTMRLHWWLADAADERLRPDPTEVADARWIDPSEFARLAPTFDDDRVFFEERFPTVTEAHAPRA